MSQSMPPLKKLRELANGQRGDFFALLVEKKAGLTRESKPYYHCRFRDAGRVVSFLAWSDDRWFDAAEREWEVGKAYKLRGVYAEHERYGPQIEIHAIRPATDEDGCDLGQLVESSKRDPAEMWVELLALAAEHIQGEPLRSLVVAALTRHAEALQRLPLTRDRAYAYRGGLLEHLVSVTRLAIGFADHYTAAHPPLDRDLVAAGAMLHELGKVSEFEGEALSPTPSVAGRLVGPLTLGRDLLIDVAKEHPGVAAETLRLLEHILLSPLYPEGGGGPRWALVPEGLLMQYADDLDGKMALYARCLVRDAGPGPFTERDPLLGRSLYKGRH